MAEDVVGTHEVTGKLAKKRGVWARFVETAPRRKRKGTGASLFLGETACRLVANFFL